MNHEDEEGASSQNQERSRGGEAGIASGQERSRPAEDSLKAERKDADPDVDVHPESESRMPQGKYSSVDPLIGQVVLGRYLIKRQIGVGGMGAVYLAEQMAITRDVALKVLRPDLMAHEYVRQRFRREAEVIGRLNHPNIVQLLDYGETDQGLAVMAMELLRGQPLNDRLTGEGPMELGDALRLGEEVAQALAAAHEAGLVHRDLKPANIFLVEHSGRRFAKVLDFGIARFLDEEATRLTSTGQIFGTPRYMSPEQAISTADVDHRADIYSLGLVLYEALVGQAPFAATTSLQYLSAHATKSPPRLRESYPAAPPPLDALIDACLQKQPADRPDEAVQVAKTLSEIRQSTHSLDDIDAPTYILSSLGSTSPSSRWKDSRKWLHRGLVALAIGVFTVFSGVLYQRWTAEPEAIVSLPVPTKPKELSQLTGGNGKPLDPADLRAPTMLAEPQLAPSLEESQSGTVVTLKPEVPEHSKPEVPEHSERPDRGSSDKNRAQNTKPLVGQGVISEGRDFFVPGLDEGEAFSADANLIRVAGGCLTSYWRGLSMVSTRGCHEECVLIIDQQCGGRLPARNREVPPGVRELAVVCGEKVVLRQKTRFREGRTRTITCE